MNIFEARKLIERLNEINCGGRPLAVYDGTRNGIPFGDSKVRPSDDDPGLVTCRSTVEPCIFCGGEVCPKGLEGRICLVI